MRGPKPNRYRGGKRPPVVNEAITRPASIPAPIGGWNAVDSPANMNALDAVVMDNWFPTTTGIELRGGRTQYAYNLRTDPKTLLTYNDGTDSVFWAATDGGFIDISTGGDKAAAASVGTLTNGRVFWRNFRTSAGTFLYAVNGVDSALLYDGTSWASITGVSVPIAITGVTTSQLINVCTFQKRLWFIQKNTLSAWYLASDTIGGAATEFPFGSIFSKGGQLIAQEAWTVDTGRGVDDYLVTVTDQGEVAIYRGTDPSDSSAWFLVGVFQTGKPIGGNCLVPYGGELLLICKTGLTPISSLLSSAVINRSRQISYKIDKAFADYATLYAGNDGWQGMLYPEEDALIFNVPVTENSTAYQLVMNTITKAWCRFTGWTSTCLGMFNSQLYTAATDIVYTSWSGTIDDTTSITASVQQAYTNFKFGGQKHVELVRPNITLSGPVTGYLSFLNDFTDNINTSTVSLTVSGSGGVWDTGVWDSAVWGADGEFVQSKWLSVQNNPGFFLSFRLQIVSSTATLTWTSNDYALRGMGIL